MIGNETKGIIADKLKQSKQHHDKVPPVQVDKTQIKRNIEDLTLTTRQNYIKSNIDSGIKDLGRVNEVYDKFSTPGDPREKKL